MTQRNPSSALLRAAFRRRLAGAAHNDTTATGGQAAVDFGQVSKTAYTHSKVEGAALTTTAVLDHAAFSLLQSPLTAPQCATQAILGVPKAGRARRRTRTVGRGSTGRARARLTTSDE